MRKIRVMLVDDEDDFREPIENFLALSGMEVEGARTIREFEARHSAFLPDIIVLDINLPEISGLEVISRLRYQTRAGLIMLTARGSLDDRLFAFGQGADSYLTKPVAAAELEAIIRSLFSRLAGEGADERTWIFDAEQWVLISPDGVSAFLSGAEYHVLAALAATPGQPVRREVLLENLGRKNIDIEDRSIDVLLSRLRRKFQGSSFIVPIKSVRGVGYVFPMPVTCLGSVQPQGN